MDPEVDPDIPYAIYIFFRLVIIWLFLDRLPYLELEKALPTIITTIPQFFLIFWLFSSYFWIDYHVWKSTTNQKYYENCMAKEKLMKSHLQLGTVTDRRILGKPEIHPYLGSIDGFG